MLRQFLCVCFLAVGPLAAEDTYGARWAELQRRIADGGDVTQLLRRWAMEDGAATRVVPESHVAPVRRRTLNGLDPDREQVRIAACQANVPPDLALAVFEHESGFDNRARGEKGELGAGQIMPSTAAAFGFDQRLLATDYNYNVRSAVAIMRWLLEHFAGDEQSAIRAYNGGTGWRSVSLAASEQIENYASAVSQLRRNYAVDCR
jgi:soluble lytic murein transglycosylase-like protein